MHLNYTPKDFFSPSFKYPPDHKLSSNNSYHGSLGYVTLHNRQAVWVIFHNTRDPDTMASSLLCSFLSLHLSSDVEINGVIFRKVSLMAIDGSVSNGACHCRAAVRFFLRLSLSSTRSDAFLIQILISKSHQIHPHPRLCSSWFFSSLSPLEC